MLTGRARLGAGRRLLPVSRAPRLRLSFVSPLGNRLTAVPGRYVALVGRYLMVSAVNVVNHQLLLQMAVRWWEWSGGWANAFAGVIAVIPAYFMSRYWVWQVDGKSSVRGEIAPFWIIALVGLIVSTGLAEAADRVFGDPLWVSAGSLVGYLIVWIAKFAILNMLFTGGDETNTEVSSV